jgi:hypothetical protein
VWLALTNREKTSEIISFFVLSSNQSVRGAGVGLLSSILFFNLDGSSFRNPMDERGKNSHQVRQTWWLSCTNLGQTLPSLASERPSLLQTGIILSRIRTVLYRLRFAIDEIIHRDDVSLAD